MQATDNNLFFPLNFTTPSQETVQCPVFASAQSLSSNISLPTPQTSFSWKEVSIDELQAVLEEQGKAIENHLTELEKQARPIETWATFISSLDETAGDVYEHVHEGLTFLEQVIPYKALEKLTPISLPAHYLGHVATLSISFLQALDTGSQGWALISKENILKESRHILRMLQGQSPADRTMLQEWEARLDAEEKALEEEKKSFGMNASYTLLSCLSLFLTSLPFKSLPAPLSFLSTSLSWALSGFELVNLNTESVKASEDQKIFHQWKNTLSRPQQELSSLQDFLDKRKEREREHLLSLKPQFKSLDSQIKSIKKRHFSRFIRELTENIRGATPKEREKIIEQELDAWDHQPFTDSLKEKLKSLKKELSEILFEKKTEEEFFEFWYAEQSEETLLKFYIDHQETIQLTTKNALKQMVNKKYEREGHLIDLKALGGKLQFGTAIATVTFNIILAILGLFTLPLAGLGWLLLCITLGSPAARLGFLGIRSYHAFKINPKQNFALLSGIELETLWVKLQISIRSYFQDAKRKRLIETATHLFHCQLRSQKNVSSEEALNHYRQAKREFEQTKTQIGEWQQRLQKLEHSFDEARWEDFAAGAALPKDSYFDSLSALQTALFSSHLDLLDPEFHQLLTQHLGVNTKDLKGCMQEHQDAVKHVLKNFFSLNEADLIAFIRNRYNT